MNITLASDCLSLELSDSYVIADIGTTTNQELICNYNLKVDYNCCDPNTYPIPSNPMSTIAITACGSALVGDVLTPYFDITTTVGIDACCVDSFTWGVVGNTTPIEPLPGNTQTASWRLYFLGGDITNTDNLVAYFNVHTTDGFIHEHEYTLTGVTIADHCSEDYAVSITSYTEPTVPTTNGFTIDTTADTITLTDTTFGQNTDSVTTNALKEGVYCITIEGRNCTGVPLVDGGDLGQRLYSESGTYFVDCGDTIKCKLAALATTCDTADPLWLYESLVYNNTCQVMTCTDVCRVYSKLMEFINNNCKALAKPCNCG